MQEFDLTFLAPNPELLPLTWLREQLLQNKKTILASDSDRDVVSVKASWTDCKYKYGKRRVDGLVGRWGTWQRPPHLGLPFRFARYLFWDLGN
jgi:hypothetical protein